MKLTGQHNKGFNVLLQVQLVVVCCLVVQTVCQLPDDIQRELNQNLAEQARIQAMREQHRNQIQNRAGDVRQVKPQRQPAPHDPNNYSYQQVSPPIQYSYYQPYGDAAQSQPAGATGAGQTSNGASGGNGGQAAAPPMNLDLNNLNFDLPAQPQAQQQVSSRRQHYTPSFTGVAGLPIMTPVANQQGADAYAPPGNAPLAPQARVQQGPPLTEADFKDITGGENYGAPSGNDFGLGEASNTAGGNGGDGNTDAQLREFGLPAEQPASSPARRGGGQLSQNTALTGMPDFGSGFGPELTGAVGGGGAAQPRQRNDATGGMDFGNFENLAGGGGSTPRGAGGSTDFDFAGQPSSSSGDTAATSVAGGAPGSLQSLLGASFPGLGGGQNGLDEFAGAGNNPQQPRGQQRLDDRALDIADLGDKSDQFSGADLGGFEQPSARNDQDFNYAAAANQQPSVVPYPDGGPQPVGTLLALTQPQSLTQARYNALPDKGTYQDYPAYQADSEPASVSEVVDATPRARRAGPGRYSTPSANALAPEHRPSELGQQYDYASAPGSADADSSDIYEELD